LLTRRSHASALSPPTSSHRATHALRWNRHPAPTIFASGSAAAWTPNRSAQTRPCSSFALPLTVSPPEHAEPHHRDAVQRLARLRWAREASLVAPLQHFDLRSPSSSRKRTRKAILLPLFIFIRSQSFVGPCRARRPPLTRIRRPQFTSDLEFRLGELATPHSISLCLCIGV
jgi:hypothetical protein